ncbi:hypothetical protein UPYG_G00214880 [Umbra pygmaea]|uniref:Uncharacterized protein n=1 Tax=Umbra pygmaea TaxID=75934 RepID=A0ABD0X6S7_UMBPY
MEASCALPGSPSRVRLSWRCPSCASPNPTEFRRNLCQTANPSGGSRLGGENQRVPKKLHGVPSDLTDGSLAAAASGPADDCQTDVVGEHQIEPPTDVTDGPPEAAVSVPGDDCKMDVVGEHKVEQLTDLTVGQPEVAAASTFSA